MQQSVLRRDRPSSQAANYPSPSCAFARRGPRAQRLLYSVHRKQHADESWVCSHLRLSIWQCCRACSESSRSRLALMRRLEGGPDLTRSAQRVLRGCAVSTDAPHRVSRFRKAQKDCVNAAPPSGRRPTPPRTLLARHWNTIKMPGALDLDAFGGHRRTTPPHALSTPNAPCRP